MPLFHIGYHKTGSTLLQEHVFNREDFGFSRLRDDRKRIHPVFVQLEPGEAVREDFATELRREAKSVAAKGLQLVISHERLSGYIVSGGYDARPIADRLHGLFPTAKVLIVVREQQSMLRSYYLQYISDGGHLPFERLVRDPQPDIRRIPPFSFAYFEYDRLVSHYRRLFGEERICVLPFEMLRKHPGDFIAALLRFCGASTTDVRDGQRLFPKDVNAAHPPLMQLVRRFANSWLTRTQLSNHGLLNIPHFSRVFDASRPLFERLGGLDDFLDRRLRRQIATATEGLYAASNARLQKLTGLDLRGYDYALPDELEEVGPQDHSWSVHRAANNG